MHILQFCLEPEWLKSCKIKIELSLNRLWCGVVSPVVASTLSTQHNPAHTRAHTHTHARTHASSSSSSSNSTSSTSSGCLHPAPAASPARRGCASTKIAVSEQLHVLWFQCWRAACEWAKHWGTLEAHSVSGQSALGVAPLTAPANKIQII